MQSRKQRGIFALAATALSFGLTSVALAQGDMDKKMDMSRYGGPVYTAAPALGVTASLVAAGGGPENFSAAKALTAMLGAKTVNAEVDKLTKQYGEDKVKSFLEVHDFAVADALKIATEAGVKLPPPTYMAGPKLARVILKAGLAKDGTFYTEYFLDKAVTHKIHMKVMDDIDAKYGADADSNYHAISNQAWYDIGHALGNKKVKLSVLH